jgi:hypothetical protein
LPNDWQDARIIDPRRGAHAFIAFGQSSKTIFRRFDGLGLGLAIAKASVALVNASDALCWIFV